MTVLFVNRDVRRRDSCRSWRDDDSSWVLDEEVIILHPWKYEMRRPWCLTREFCSISPLDQDLGMWWPNDRRLVDKQLGWRLDWFSNSICGFTNVSSLIHDFDCTNDKRSVFENMHSRRRKNGCRLSVVSACLPSNNWLRKSFREAVKPDYIACYGRLGCWLENEERLGSDSHPWSVGHRPAMTVSGRCKTRVVPCVASFQFVDDKRWDKLCDGNNWYVVVVLELLVVSIPLDSGRRFSWRHGTHDTCSHAFFEVLGKWEGAKNQSKVRVIDMTWRVRGRGYCCEEAKKQFYMRKKKKRSSVSSRLLRVNVGWKHMTLTYITQSLWFSTWNEMTAHYKFWQKQRQHAILQSFLSLRCMAIKGGNELSSPDEE